MSRRRELARAMREAGLTSERLGALSSYHPVTIRRFRTGARAIGKKAWGRLQTALTLGRYADVEGQRGGGEL